MIPTQDRKMRTEPLMYYCAFFRTEDEAIEHCRNVNRGLGSKDPGCCAVVDGPGETYDDCTLVKANYVVVDLETARDLTNDGYTPAYLIVT